MGYQTAIIMKNLFSEEVLRIASFLRENPEGKVIPSTHAIGGGQWSIELHGLLWLQEEERSVREFLAEFVGSNGTRDEEASDLHSPAETAIRAAEFYNKAFHGGGYVAK